MRTFRSSSATQSEFFNGKHRFEHWYRDNTVYFITSRVRDRFPAFDSEETKQIFWDRFNHWTDHYGFVPWITTLLDNHYHTIGYLKVGENLGPMMQRIHGSVSKLVNDRLPMRHLPFWRCAGNKDYFDGCLRDPTQTRRAFKYTKLQAVRARLVSDHRKYPHTRIAIEVERGIARALELNAFLAMVPYARYQRGRGQAGR